MTDPTPIPDPDLPSTTDLPEPRGPFPGHVTIPIVARLVAEQGAPPTRAAYVVNAPSMRVPLVSVVCVEPSNGTPRSDAAMREQLAPAIVASMGGDILRLASLSSLFTDAPALEVVEDAPQPDERGPVFRVRDKASGDTIATCPSRAAAELVARKVGAGLEELARAHKGVHEPVPTLPREVAVHLDPGILRTVEWLRARGFETTDSGDGVSKAELIAAGYALPFSHVFMRCAPAELAAEADRLRRELVEHGVEGFRVEASYSPDDGVGVLAMLGAGEDERPKEVHTHARFHPGAWRNLIEAASDLIATFPSGRPWTKEEQALIVAFQRAAATGAVVDWLEPIDALSPERVELWDAVHAYASASYTGEERGPSGARMDAVVRVESAVNAIALARVGTAARTLGAIPGEDIVATAKRWRDAVRAIERADADDRDGAADAAVVLASMREIARDLLGEAEPHDGLVISAVTTGDA